MPSAEASELWPIIWRSPRQKKAQRQATEVLHCIPSNSGPCQPKTVNFVSSPESVSILESIERK